MQRTTVRLTLDPLRRLFAPPADRRLAAAMAAPPPPPGTIEPAAPGMPRRVALERADLGMGARMRIWRDEQRSGIRTPWLPVGLHWRFEDMEMVWESAEIGTMLPLARMVEAMRSEAIISGLMDARNAFISKPCTYTGDPWLCDWLRGKPATYDGDRLVEPASPSRFRQMAPKAALLDLLWTGPLAGAAAAELVDDPDLGLPVMQTRDLHRVRYDWGDRVWKYLGETNEWEIDPGNGRWILFMPYATHRPWRSGSWLPLALAFIVMQTATYDAGRFQATNADPLKYIEIPDSAPPEEGDKLEQFVQLWWERNPRVVLRFGAKAGIVESNGQGYQIYEKQRTWAKQQINFTLRGSTATSGDQEGIFNDPEEAYDVAEQLVQTNADSLAECLNEQLIWPTLKRFGLIRRRAEAPAVAWDTRSAKRKVADAAAVGQVCDVVTKLDALGKARGRMVDLDAFLIQAGLTVPWVEAPPQAQQPEGEGVDQGPPQGGGDEEPAAEVLPEAPGPLLLPAATQTDSVVEQTTPEGSIASRPAQRPRAKRERRAAAKSQDNERPPQTIEEAQTQLREALAELDALGPEDEERHEGAAKFEEKKHPRGADGKFGDGGAPAKPKPKGTKDGLGTGKDAKQARKDSKSAEEASAKAKTAEEHKAAAKANADAAERHRAAAKASRRKEYREAHMKVAEAHEALARLHEGKASVPDSAPKSAPAPKSTSVPRDPKKLRSDVESMVGKMPVEDTNNDAAVIFAGMQKSKEHIKNTLPKMADTEKGACYAFSNGYDYEMRALERGASKDELVKSRMKENGEDEAKARAHVEESAKILPQFHAAQEKLRTTEPPPPPLYRGMAVSDRTLHELLTKDTWKCAGMSSSASLSPHIAKNFSDSGKGEADYRGDKIEHSVVLQINKGKSAPIMHPDLSLFTQEREQVLPRTGEYRVTKRTKSPAGHVILHLEEV